MTFIWGSYARGRLQPVGEDYDAPRNEIVEVRDTYGVPLGIPGLTEQLVFNNVKSGVESNGATLTYCQIDIDWLQFQTRIIYQYKSPGLIVAIIILAVVLLLVAFGLWIILQNVYRLVGPTGTTLVLIGLLIFGGIILVSLALPILTSVSTPKQLKVKTRYENDVPVIYHEKS